jgi:fatty acid-binding protein DegV
MARFGIMTDADACIPQSLLAELDLLTVPLEDTPFDEAEPPVNLRREAAPLDAAPALHTLARATSLYPAILYVGAGDGYGGSPSIRAAVEAVAAMSPIRRDLRAFDSNAALMGCGWQAIAAARVGDDIDAAIAAADAVRSSVQVLALLEYPQFAGIPGDILPGQLTRARAIVSLAGEHVDVVQLVPKREIGLTLLRDLLARRAEEGEGALHLAVHHAGAAAAAGALAKWAERALDPAEVLIAPLNRHAASRLGPGMVGVAWYREAPAS